MQSNTENDVVLVWKLYVAFSYICSILSYVQESLLPWVHPGNFSLFFIGSIDAFVSVIPPSCVLLSVATLRSYQHISWFSGLSWKLIAVYIQCVHYCQICISFHSHNQVFILFVTLLILFANVVIVAINDVVYHDWNMWGVEEQLGWQSYGILSGLDQPSNVQQHPHGPFERGRFSK